MFAEIEVATWSRAELVDITARIQDTISQKGGARDCVVVVFVPHTTAGVTIYENSDPDVVRDFLHQLEKMAPWDNGYRHLEGNSAAHIKTSLVGSSVVVPVSGGRLALGAWQAVFFCEFDGPRRRTAYVSTL